MLGWAKGRTPTPVSGLKEGFLDLVTSQLRRGSKSASVKGSGKDGVQGTGEAPKAGTHCEWNAKVGGTEMVR